MAVFGMHSPTFRTARRSIRTIVGVSVAIVASIVALASCSSDSPNVAAVASTESTEVASTEAPTTEVAASEVEPTEAADTEAPATEPAPITEPLSTEVPSTDAGSTDTETPPSTLPADSPTCQAFNKVKTLNDRSGALTAEFQRRLLDGASESAATAAAEWKEFQRRFAADAEIVLPELKEAYATLSAEQPKFAKDFANINDVTGDLIKLFTTITWDDLDQMETKLAEAVPTEKTIAAGLSTLTIDAFSRATCNVTFANT
jgi:hypothetical protein